MMMNGYRYVSMPSHVHIISDLKLLQFKTSHSKYYMPVKLSDMRKTQKGKYFHMLWSCEGWLNSGKEYALSSQHVYRFSLLLVFVCLEMLILETYLKEQCNQAFIATKKSIAIHF